MTGIILSAHFILLEVTDGNGREKKLMRVRGVRVFQLTEVRESRGLLIAAQYRATLPFVPRRCFVVMDVPSKQVRGEHAHRKLKQLLVCVRGSVTVRVDDGKSRQTIRLDHPSKGLYVPPMIWAAQFNYTANAVLMVFASASYDARDYIQRYDEFQRLCRR